MGSVIQGALGFMGGRQQLEAQQQDFISGQQFSAQQAALNRQFQAQQQTSAEDWMSQMSDTAMQRRVADLKAAGLNPMLAIAQGGASTPGIGAPGGSMGSSPGVPNLPNPFAEGSAAYNSAQVAQAQAKQLDAQANKTTSETPSRRQSAIDPATGEVVVDADPGHELGNATLDQIKASTGLQTSQAGQVAENIKFIAAQVEGQGLQNAGQSIQNYLAGLNAQVLTATKNALISIAQSDQTIKGFEAEQAKAQQWVRTGDIGTVFSFINAVLGVAGNAAQVARPMSPAGIGTNSAMRILGRGGQ